MPDSDSGSESAASSASQLPRLPSPEPPAEPVRETITSDNQDQQIDEKLATEAIPAGNESGSKTIPDSALDPEAEPLHIVWEENPEDVGETEHRPYFEGASAVE